VDRLERGESHESARATDLTREVRAGTARYWRIDLALTPDGAGSARETVSVLDRVAALGRVVRSSPPLPDLDTGRFEGRLQFTLLADGGREELECALRAIPHVRSVEIEPEDPVPSPGVENEQPHRWVRVRADRLDALSEGVLDLRLEMGRLKASSVDLPEAARPHLDRVDFQLDRVRETLTELRLVPFDTLARRLHGTAHELGRELGKEFRFEIVGGDVRVDRSVLERLADPLAHVVRNALDHGLETSDQRRREGKPPHGTLRLSLARKGDRVHLSLTDDGRGLDADRLRSAAVDLELITRDEADRLTEDEALMLVTLPRFSTATEVTRVSGRGVGLDHVRTSVERLGGQIEIRGRPGKGCELRMSVPLSLAMIQALLVRSAGETYVVPVDPVIRTVNLEAGARCDSLEEGADRGIDRVRLDQLLGAAGPDPPPGPDRGWALILDTGGGRVALLVDDVLGVEEIDVRPLYAPLAEMREYAGAALRKDGGVALVLDPVYITNGASRSCP